MEIARNPDFVNSKRFEFSILKVEQKFPDGCPDHMVADLLDMTPEELEGEWDVIVRTLRGRMGVTL